MVWRATDPQGNEADKVRFDVVPYMGQSNVDLGCGPAKVWPHFLGVDNGKDTDLFGVQMRPDMVVGSCERMPQLADGAFDCVFSSHLLEHIEDHVGALREWWRLVSVGGYLCLYLPHADLYPNIGQPGANPDHRHDFRQQDIVDAMVEIAPDFDLVECEKRDQMREYSFFVVFKKTPPGTGQTFTWAKPRAPYRVAIVRPGAYGDALWGGALARHYAAAGAEVTVYTGHAGAEVLKHDKAITRVVKMPNGMLDDAEMVLYFLWESRKYTQFVNLIGVVEGRLLPHPNDICYWWPDAARRARMSRNYYDAMTEIAGVGRGDKLRQYFEPSAEELAWANEQKEKLFGGGPLVVVAPTGSGGPKTWPHVNAFCERMAAAGVYTVVVGELRQDVESREPFVVVLGKELPIRLSLALAQVADVVVGEESAVVNSVAHREMAKVVLLSHSSPDNLTKYWTNTAALSADALGCHPCHRLHRSFEFCTRDSKTGFAACQAALGPDMVADLVLERLDQSAAARKPAAFIGAPTEASAA